MEDARIKRGKLRAVLSGDDVVIPAPLFDPLSAKIADELGFACGFLSGALVSFSRLAAPDMALLTLDELAGQARQIARVAGLPILADADHGFGNALNVKRTVEELELAGVAGLTVEDTLLPTPPGAEAATLIPLPEACGKMRAAVDARGDAELVVIGRTNLAASPPDDALERVRAYAKCGVDGLFLAGVADAEQLARLGDTGLPLVVLGRPGSQLDVSELRELGVRIVIRNGHDGFVAAAVALRSKLEELAIQRMSAPSLAREAYGSLDKLVGGPEARGWLEAHKS